MSEQKEPTKSAGEQCSEVEEHLAEVLAGTAIEALLEHAAECDHCRDLLFDAERAMTDVALSGADYQHPQDFEERVRAALPKEQNDTAQENNTTALQETAEPEPESKRETRQTPGVKARDSEPAQRRTTAGLVIELRRHKAWWGALAVAASVAALWSMEGSRRGGQSADLLARDSNALVWEGTVERVARGFGSQEGLRLCGQPGEACTAIGTGDTVPRGARLVTDGLTRVRLQLNDGTRLMLDRATELVFDAVTERRFRLERGDVVAEVETVAGAASNPTAPGSVATVELPQGRIEVLGTKFAVHTDEASSRVDVSRGLVRLVDNEGRDVLVGAGQGGRLFTGVIPTLEPLPSFGESFLWSERAFAVSEDPDEGPRGLGALRAQKPGETEERKGAVTLTRHAVKLRIVGNMARTEVEEVFTNHTDDVLEGIFRFPLPADAQIERLALEVDGRMEEGAFVDRDRAAAIWRGAIVNSSKKPQPVRDEIVWVPGPWKDPALLEWQSGGRFELRIFPIPKRGARRIILAYTQKLRASGDLVRYTYPLAHDPGGSTRVDDFSLDVQLQGQQLQGQQLQAQQAGLVTRGYDLQRMEEAGDSGRVRYAMQRRDFAPSGDVVLEYRLPAAQREVAAWAYKPATDAEPGYAAFTFRPRLPARASRAGRAYVFVLDRSRSMFGEPYRRAVTLLSHLVREMDRNDLVQVLSCDVSCDSLSKTFQRPGVDVEDRVNYVLGAVQPEGASDLIAALRSAAAWEEPAGGRELKIVYLGDGASTLGESQPALLRRALEQSSSQTLPRAVPRHGSISAVTFGNDADLLALSAVTQAGGGVVIPYSPGQSPVEAAFAVLGATYGHALKNARVSLPQGFSEVVPRQIGTVPAGGEFTVVARMQSDRITGQAQLTGTVGDESFEQQYDVEVVASSSDGNAFVPRLFAAAQIAELEQESGAEARARIVELSGRFNVASRYTSLLVLESPAMFKAFGLNNQRSTPVWTGEIGDYSTEAEAKLDVGLESSWGDDFEESRGFSGLGLSEGVGSGASEMARDRSGGPPRSAAPVTRVPEKKKSESQPVPGAPLSPDLLPEPFPSERRRPIGLPSRVPMRKVWKRVGTIEVPAIALAGATREHLASMEARLEANPLSRDALKSLYTGYLLAGDLERASELAERWSEKEPLDPEALTARADVAAQRGDRELAIRILGSVLDVRPGDHRAQQRLARLFRWKGNLQRSCRHLLAAAQLRTRDAELLADTVRCLRDAHDGALANELLQGADEKTRRTAEQRLAKQAEDTVKNPHWMYELSGDFRLEAKWDFPDDLDVVVIHPDGHRISWLGAPTREVITAKDMDSIHGEALALRGAKPGHYAVEMVRANNESDFSGSGELTIKVGNTTRSIPFTINGPRVRVATVKVSMRSELVPL